MRRTDPSAAERFSAKRRRLFPGASHAGTSSVHFPRIWGPRFCPKHASSRDLLNTISRRGGGENPSGPELGPPFLPPKCVKVGSRGALNEISGKGGKDLWRVIQNPSMIYSWPTHQFGIELNGSSTFRSRFHQTVQSERPLGSQYKKKSYLCSVALLRETHERWRPLRSNSEETYVSALWLLVPLCRQMFPHMTKEFHSLPALLVAISLSRLRFYVQKKEKNGVWNAGQNFRRGTQYF